MSRIVVLSLLALCAFVSSVSAQIIYEPVRYQYESNGTLYYYGGSDPMVHQVAHELSSPGGSFGRANGWVFFGGDTRSHREEAYEPTRVYSDATRTYNAGLLGMTPDDARDEAYANSDRNFVKRDIVVTAVPQSDGSWVVPAHTSATVRVYKSDGTLVPQGPAARTVTDPKPLFIIPKDSLEKPLHQQQSDKQVASAN